MFVCWTSPLQGEMPVCHDCLVVNGTSKFIIIYLHGTAARVLTSGHPPETITRVLTYGHSPGSPEQVFLQKQKQKQKSEDVHTVRENPNWWST